jgi:signal recognition particle subunit SRP68
MAAMTDPATPETVDVPVVPERNLPFSLDVLHLVKTSQAKNGLRHGDYLRYRQYCTRRLRRIRKSNAVRFMYADKRGKNFGFKSVAPDDVQDERLLLVPLMMAERAWSYAMQLKNDNENDEYPRKFFHMKRRLAKAAKWSTELRMLCSELCDARTGLEAEAYEAVMHANLIVQNEDWAGAAAKFMLAHKIYDELSQVGSTEERELFRDRIAEDIDPPLAFCQYNNEVEHGTEASAEMLLKLRMQTKGSDLLQGKLNAALAETRRKQTETMTSLSWGGNENVPLRAPRVRDALLKVSDSEYALNQLKEQNTPEKEALFLEVLNAYDDAGVAVRDEIKKAKSKGAVKAEALTAELNIVLCHLRFHKLQISFRRTSLLADELDTKLIAAERKPRKLSAKALAEAKLKKGEPEETVEPGDLLRQYQALVATADEMVNVPGVENDETAHSGAVAVGLGAKAFVSFYAGKVFMDRDEFPEANALFQRAEKRAGQALDLHKERAAKYSDITTQQNVVQNSDKLNKLIEDTHVQMALARARNCLKMEGAYDPLSKANKEKRTRKYLLERLDDFDGGDPAEGFNICEWPPTMKPIMCEPFFFDTAWKCLENRLPMAEIEAEIARLKKEEEDKKKEEGGGGSGLWGYLGY